MSTSLNEAETLLSIRRFGGSIISLVSVNTNLKGSPRTLTSNTTYIRLKKWTIYTLASTRPPNTRTPRSTQKKSIHLASQLGGSSWENIKPTNTCLQNTTEFLKNLRKFDSITTTPPPPITCLSPPRQRLEWGTRPLIIDRLAVGFRIWRLIIIF